MKAKEYLQQIKIMNAEINADLEELETLNALATKTTSVMGDERVQSSGSQQKLENYAVKIADLQREISRDIAECLRLKKEARKLIRESCDDNCITLLSKRYFENKKWEEIAVEMNYTYKWVSGGLHGMALAQLQKGLDKNEHCKDRLHSI